MTQPCRLRGDDAELMGAPFTLPPEALDSAAAAEPSLMTPAATAVVTPTTAGDGLFDLFSPAIPVPGSEFLAGTGLETLEAPANDYSSFGDLIARSFSSSPSDCLRREITDEHIKGQTLPLRMYGSMHAD